MLRAVVDPGVLISSLISPRGAPGARPRFREWFSLDEATIIVGLIRDAGEACADVPTDAPPPPDDGDRYLIDLAVASRADCLVTGDAALLSHTVQALRIASPRALIAVLDALVRR